VERSIGAQDGLRTKLWNEPWCMVEDILIYSSQVILFNRQEFRNALDLEKCLLRNAARDGDEAVLRSLIKLAMKNSGGPLMLDWDYATDRKSFKSEVIMWRGTGKENEMILMQESRHFQKTQVMMITATSQELTDPVIQLLQTRIFILKNNNTTVLDF
jgi:hypothetical protein